MLIKKGERGLIVPLKEVLSKNTGDTVSLTFGGRTFSVHFDGPGKVLDCMDVPKEFECLTGYWFALRSFFPDAKVYQGRL